ncbi:tetratricopeptide repeat protein [Paractinoplanes globisporus]|uniref:Tetratricopeptide repeat protein n=1 Tax=Paractinoplanes globisporus TaxID=113565 RepID=A0ABW6W5L2_9ACTN|nr:tetratricopeptide repeat protein [Actinoplanes globisporus]
MSQEELVRARATGDRAGEVDALYSLARVSIRGGDLASGESLAGEALEAAVRSGDRALEERPRHVLAAVARLSGDLSRARDLYRASIALNESLGNDETVNSEYHNLAFCELRLGNVAHARDLFAAGREEVFRRGWEGFVPYVCVAGAALAATEGDLHRAARLTGVTDAAFEALGQVPDPDDAAELTVARTAAREALGEATFAAEYAYGHTLTPREAFAAEVA